VARYQLALSILLQFLWNISYCLSLKAQTLVLSCKHFPRHLSICDSTYVALPDHSACCTILILILVPFCLVLVLDNAINKLTCFCFLLKVDLSSCKAQIQLKLRGSTEVLSQRFVANHLPFRMANIIAHNKSLISGQP
jgi:hypothetical protein